MRPASAGEISAETVSVPLRGRRQVHLQQRELLNPDDNQKNRERDETVAAY